MADEAAASALTPEELETVAALVLRATAVVLAPDHVAVVESRLLPVARRRGHASVSALVRELDEEPDSALRAEVVEAVLSSETSFFRDPELFESLRREVLPELARRNAVERRLSVWCGACSTGEEPYSVAMMLREHFPELPDWHVRIVASDASQRALDRARQGRFNTIEMHRGLPERMRKYFRPEGGEWVVREEIASLVEFRPINLVSSWPPLPRFDVVLMRNVLRYFDGAIRAKVVVRLLERLKPGAYLFLGAHEELKKTRGLTRLRPFGYRRAA